MKVKYAIKKQGLFIFQCLWSSPFVVSLSNHKRTALRQAQDERENRLLSENEKTLNQGERLLIWQDM